MVHLVICTPLCFTVLNSVTNKISKYLHRVTIKVTPVISWFLDPCIIIAFYESTTYIQEYVAPGAEDMNCSKVTSNNS